NAAGASFHGVTDWHAIDWKSVSRNVRRLQARIVKATQEKKWGKVKALQRLLTHSFSGKALAVRRVTENQGKNTPGVDKVTWNTPQKKINAVYSLRQKDYHPQPLRRIYIPKKNGKKRPLGIPAMKCRAMQALYLLALDPVAETTEEGTPQGGIISPVLANMTLDGLEKKLRERYPKTTVKGIAAKVNFVRYADDFIVTAVSKELLEQEVKPLVEIFMEERGLQLSK